jgi:hypothetical protein
LIEMGAEVKLRRLILLFAWIYACLQLPTGQVELSVAMASALVIYIGLQLAINAGHQHS